MSNKYGFWSEVKDFLFLSAGMIAFTAIATTIVRICFEVGKFIWNF